MGSIGLPATGQIFHIAAVWSGYILLITISNVRLGFCRPVHKCLKIKKKVTFSLDK
jgi:hypothetical protein